MSHDCSKVPEEIQFVFINSQEHGGDHSQSWFTEAVCFLLFKQPLVVVSVCESVSVCGSVFEYVSYNNPLIM